MGPAAAVSASCWFWTRRFTAADMGVLIDNCPFFTARRLTLEVSAPRSPTLGYGRHWGVWLKNGADVLITRFNMSAVFVQDFAIQVRLGQRWPPSPGQT